MPDKQEYKAAWLRPEVHAKVKKCAAFREKSVNDFIEKLVDKDYQKIIKNA